MTHSTLDRAKRSRKPRFTAGGISSKNYCGIRTGNIDEKKAHWYGRILVHGESREEIKALMKRILKALNK